jgi:uncharacterized protein (DUF3820 family)
MPSRYLRPALRNSERFNSVSLLAQTLWVRILTLVDDFGRYNGRKSVLLGETFAVWNEINPANAVELPQLAAACEELQDKGLVFFYEADGKKVLQMLQWQERPRAGCKEKWPGPGKSLQAAPDSGNLPQVHTDADKSVAPTPTPTPTPTPCVPTPTPPPERERNGEVDLQAERIQWVALTRRITELEKRGDELDREERRELATKKILRAKLQERQASGL